MASRSLVVSIAGLVWLTGCATGYESTWKAPDAAPLAFEGQKVAAIVMMKSSTQRRIAEETLAKEITERGAQGIAMYTLLPDATPSNEAAAKAALERAGIVGAVVMRPVSVDKDMVVTNITSMHPTYGGYWGGYYGYGWGSPYAGPITDTEVRLDTIVTIETLVYSLKQNKLVWSGTSKTTNPSKVDKLVTKLSDAAAAELQKQGLVKGP